MKKRLNFLSKALMYLLLLSFVNTQPTLQVVLAVLLLITFLLFLYQGIGLIAKQGIRPFLQSGGPDFALTWIFFLAMCLLLAFEHPGWGLWPAAAAGTLLVLSVSGLLAAYILKHGRETRRNAKKGRFL